ncbi:hypothetical protein B0T18DRAFT_242416 [Schizothecium vesticola]|uniref:Secreted protein n=1 Tax=Schizothecium vesticola TaxID=314040 RepID=A0AA40EII1_9PEZI|nr:hypothetical protein B0T18DRAFT_242416 [Schizothecium vesticola]
MAMRWGRLLFTAVVGGSRLSNAQARSISAAKRVDAGQNGNSTKCESGSGDTSSRGSFRLGVVRSGGGFGGRGWRMARRLVFDGGERQVDQCSTLILRRDWRRARGLGGPAKLRPPPVETRKWDLARKRRMIGRFSSWPRLLFSLASLHLQLRYDGTLCLCSMLPGDGCDNTPVQATSSFVHPPSLFIVVFPTAPHNHSSTHDDSHAIGLQMCL